MDIRLAAIWSVYNLASICVWSKDVYFTSGQWLATNVFALTTHIYLQPCCGHTITTNMHINVVSPLKWIFHSQQELRGISCWKTIIDLRTVSDYLSTLWSRVTVEIVKITINIRIKVRNQSQHLKHLHRYLRCQLLHSIVSQHAI